jgi:hypothetical protein
MKLLTANKRLHTENLACGQFSGEPQRWATQFGGINVRSYRRFGSCLVPLLHNGANLGFSWCVLGVRRIITDLLYSPAKRVFRGSRSSSDFWRQKPPPIKKYNFCSALGIRAKFSCQSGSLGRGRCASVFCRLVQNR